MKDAFQFKKPIPPVISFGLDDGQPLVEFTPVAFEDPLFGKNPPPVFEDPLFGFSPVGFVSFDGVDGEAKDNFVPPAFDDFF